MADAGIVLRQPFSLKQHLEVSYVCIYSFQTG